MTEADEPMRIHRWTWSTRRVVAVAFSISIFFNFVSTSQVLRVTGRQGAQSARVAKLNAKQVADAKSIALVQANTIREQAKTIRTIEKVGNAAVIEGCNDTNHLRKGLVKFVDDSLARSKANAQAMVDSPTTSPAVKATALKNLAALIDIDTKFQQTFPQKKCVAPFHLTPKPTVTPAPAAPAGPTGPLP